MPAFEGIPEVVCKVIVLSHCKLNLIRFGPIQTRFRYLQMPSFRKCIRPPRSIESIFYKVYLLPHHGSLIIRGFDRCGTVGCNVCDSVQVHSRPPQEQLVGPASQTTVAPVSAQHLPHTDRSEQLLQEPVTASSDVPAPEGPCLAVVWLWGMLLPLHRRRPSRNSKGDAPFI